MKLEYTLKFEKVVVLECGHSCHHDCLFSLIDTSIPLVLENFEAVMPRCTTCGEPGIPLDTSLHLELIKKKMDVPPTPISDAQSLSPVAQWSHDRQKHSRVSVKSISSLDSDSSHRSQSSVSSLDSSDYKSNVTAKSVQEISPAIPSPILRARIRQSAPIVNLTPECDTVVAKSTYLSGSNGPKDVYVTSAVTVQIPSDNQQLSPTTMNSLPHMQDSEHHSSVTDYIRNSVPDWKGLDYNRFGKIRLCDKFYISPDGSNWQQLDCYLFESILVFIKRYSDRRPSQVKGSVAIQEHLVSLLLPPTESRSSHHLRLNLSTDSLPELHLKTSDSAVLENWYTALVDSSTVFPSHRLIPSDDTAGQRLVGATGYSVLPTSSHVPTDTVILVPLAGSPKGSKLSTIRNTIYSIMREMSMFDRISIVPYGGPTQVAYGLAYNTWKSWRKVVESLQPTASVGSRSDLASGIDTALQILASRKTQNPVSNIFVISDSLAEFSSSHLDSISSQSAQQNVSIHAFGVSNHHSADILEDVVSKCSGNYHYLRMWDELYQIMVGQFRSVQSYTHCDLTISLQTPPGVSIVGVAGHNPKVSLQNTTTSSMESSPLTPTTYTTERMTVSDQLIDLGNMTSSEQRTFLVQVKISGDSLSLESPGRKAKLQTIELFDTTLMFSSFAGRTDSSKHGDVYFVPVGGVSVAVESLNSFIQDLIESPQLSASSRFSARQELLDPSSPSSVYSTSSLLSSPTDSLSDSVKARGDDEIAAPPSIVHGDFITGDQGTLDAPLYLSLEKCDIRVAQRRIQLTAISILEYIVRTDMRSHGLESISKSIDTARAIIAGLYDSAHTSSGNDPQRVQVSGLHGLSPFRRQNNDARSDQMKAMSLETGRLVEILDNMLATASDEIKRGIAFEEDYRKLLIQNIGILRAEKGFSLRTPLEALFLQRQSVNNVL